MPAHLKAYLDSMKITNENTSVRSQRIAAKLALEGVIINDANTTLFTAAQLDQIEAAFLAFPRLTAEAPALVPVINVDSGADSYSFTVYDANNASTQAADGAVLTPTDLTGTPGSATVIQYRDAFTLTDKEVRQSAKTGTPLETFGATSVSANLQDRQDQCAMVGDGTRLGVLNPNGTQTYVVPADGTGASALWSAKTGELILRDMCAVVDQVANATRGKHRANTLVMGEDRRLLISQTKRTSGGGTDQSVLGAFNQARPGVQVIGSYFMNNTPVAVTPIAGLVSQRLVAFEKSPSNLGRVVAMGPTILSLDVLNLVTTFQCKCRNGGTIFRRPLSACVGLPASGGI